MVQNSPSFIVLLGNLNMRRFVLAWKQRGLEQCLGSRIVIYADDLVILCRRGKAEEALLRMHEIISQLKFMDNEEQNRVDLSWTVRCVRTKRSSGGSINLTQYLYFILNRITQAQHIEQTSGLQ